MTTPPDYRWLRVAGLVTLALAALVALLAVYRAREERHARQNVGARAEAIMNEIEAEARRIEEESKK